jgi:hypothetical protein
VPCIYNRTCIQRVYPCASWNLTGTFNVVCMRIRQGKIHETYGMGAIWLSKRIYTRQLPRYWFILVTRLHCHRVTTAPWYAWSEQWRPRWHSCRAWVRAVVIVAHKHVDVASRFHEGIYSSPHKGRCHWCSCQGRLPCPTMDPLPPLRHTFTS